MSDSNNTIKIYTGPTGNQYYVDPLTGDLVGKVGRKVPPGREEAGKPAQSAKNGCVDLTTHHKRRKSGKLGKLIVYPDGSLLTVTKNRGNPFADQKRDWVRGKVSGFSVASRRRMMRTISKLDKTYIPCFCGLTYPEEWPEDPKEWKRQFKNLMARLYYHYPNAGSVMWRLENQKRGAPHYHMLVWGVGYTELRKFLPKNWFEVVGSGDPKHLTSGTSVEQVRSWRGVTSYVAKYIAKVEALPPGWEHVGRFWGIVKRDRMHWSRVEEYEIPQGKVELAMRYMRRYAGLITRDYPSLSIYINDPEQWKRALLE